METENLPHWRFPLNDGGEKRGFNAGYDAKFRSEMVRSLAREICQNSLDNKLDDCAPVHVDFHLFRLKKKDFPDYERYRDFLEACRDYWRAENPNGADESSNEVRFLSRALNCLEQEDIPVLRISDHHTTGARYNIPSQNKETGMPEKLNEWEGLTHATGIQFKSAGASGSFGVGKAAAFACSDLMTVFYSTSNNAGQHLSKGVVHWATFEDKEHYERQNTGYYCIGQKESVREECTMDHGFCREDGDFGTDVYILGFHLDDNDDWNQQLLEAVVTDFIYALQNQLLEVTVDGCHLAKENLKAFIDTSAAEAAADGANPDWIRQALLNYEILTSGGDQVHRADFAIEESGEAIGKLYLSVLTGRAECSKNIMMTRRNGMKICDWGPHRQFPRFPFEGICYAEGLALNERLRSMENPEHTEWKAGRSQSAGMKNKDRKLLSQMSATIRNYLKEIMAQAPGDDIDAIGAAAFLPEDFMPPSESNQEGAASSGTPASDRVEIRKRQNDQSIAPDGAEDGDTETQAGRPAADGDEDDGFSEGERDSEPSGSQEDSGNSAGGGDSEPKGQEDRVNPNKSGNKSRKREKHIGLSSFHYVCASLKDHRYRMTLTPKHSAKHLHLRVFLSAETERMDAPIRTATMNGQPLEVNENEIFGFGVERGETYRLDVTFDVEDYCSVEVSAYEVEA